MKVLVVILGIFCLLISLYPCCIDDNCEPTAVEKIAEHENDQENKECGLCSPFINCGTCTGFIPGAEEVVTVSEPQPIVFSNIRTFI